MHRIQPFLHPLASLLLCCLSLLPMAAQQTRRSALPAGPANAVEDLINRVLSEYPLHPDNRFRLAAYAELKGQYSDAYQTLTLPFGELATFSFYPRNCLLRTSNLRVYHLEPALPQHGQAAAMNQALDDLFEGIPLLGNYGADSVKIAFVDRFLALKNIQPFDKIYLRHILIRYGQYDHANQRIEFRSEWLQADSLLYLAPGEAALVRKPADPLWVKLDKTILRGYYIYSGGTVYVEDVKRDVLYATGELSEPNVTAFKVFVQKLFVQTTQQIVGGEQERLNEMAALLREDPQRPPAASGAVSLAPQPRLLPPSWDHPPVAPSATLVPDAPGQPALRPLYHPDNWVPMLIGILRSKGISLTDPELVRYLRTSPAFPRMLEMMTEEERRKAQD